MTDMRRTWLVQRLEAPRDNGGLLGPENPFAFGGGLKNGGLSTEAMDLLRGIFSFDYMGAAEFEFGAVPKALQALANDSKELVASAMTLPLTKVARHWSDRSKDQPTGEAVVYVIARRDQMSEVQKRIALMAARDLDLKESTHLPEVLRPNADPERWTPRTGGWLELDNGFFFFTDESMWRSTAALFGVEASEAVSA